MIERTVVLIKPDAVKKRLDATKQRDSENEDIVDRIIQRYLDKGLRMLIRRGLRMFEHQATEFYKVHEDRPVFQGLVLSMISGRSQALLLEGENAIQEVRDLNGPWKDAPEGTIRGDFPSAGGPFNMVHGSDSLESAAYETEVIFGKHVREAMFPGAS